MSKQSIKGIASQGTQDDYVVQEAAEQPEQQSTIRKADTYRESIE
jgi:hypothetical protein